MARYARSEARSELIRSNSGLAGESCDRLQGPGVHAVPAGIQARRGLMCGAW
jgi:hypothetical protein